MKTALIIAGLLAAYGVVGHFDYEDEVAAEQHYCAMVEAKHWPAYEPEIQCNGLRR